MTANLTDEQLVELAVGDDTEAFGEITRRWERKIFALCYGMLNREEDARDAAQETFFSAFRNLKSFRGEAKVSSWLHRIAVNQCLTKQRRTKVRAENSLDDEDAIYEETLVATDEFSAAEILEQNEKHRVIRRAVRSLPFDLRQVIVMKEFEDMTFQEISDALEIPLSTVKSRLYTALKQLRLKLEKTPIGIA
jgi:RNA polymerase sigma-70 factor (ECF subfamily)